MRTPALTNPHAWIRQFAATTKFQLAPKSQFGKQKVPAIPGYFENSSFNRRPQSGKRKLQAKPGYFRRDTIEPAVSAPSLADKFLGHSGTRDHKHKKTRAQPAPMTTRERRAAEINRDRRQIQRLKNTRRPVNRTHKNSQVKSSQ